MTFYFSSSSTKQNPILSSQVKTCQGQTIRKGLPLYTRSRNSVLKVPDLFRRRCELDTLKPFYEIKKHRGKRVGILQLLLFPFIKYPNNTLNSC